MIYTDEVLDEIDQIKQLMLELLLFGHTINSDARYMMLGEFVPLIIGDEYYNGMDVDEASIVAGIIIETMSDYLKEEMFDEFIEYTESKLLEQERYEYLHKLELHKDAKQKER